MALNQVFVTNKNTEPHSDRYDGEEFVFPPGEPVMIPIDAAQHMLGYGLEDKTDTLVRLGKAMRFDPEKRQFVEDLEGVKWLARFVFEEPVVKPKSALAAALEGAELA